MSYSTTTDLDQKANISGLKSVQSSKFPGYYVVCPLTPCNTNIPGKSSCLTFKSQTKGSTSSLYLSLNDATIGKTPIYLPRMKSPVAYISFWYTWSMSSLAKQIRAESLFFPIANYALKSHFISFCTIMWLNHLFTQV